jgi:hypothetical protein
MQGRGFRLAIAEKVLKHDGNFEDVRNDSFSLSSQNHGSHIFSRFKSNVVQRSEWLCAERFLKGYAGSFSRS